MIRVNKLNLRRGTRLLLENTDFIINPGDRVGVVGKNGAGKTSLFSLLEGKLEADAGSIDMPPGWVIATVEQHIAEKDRPAREFVIDGDQHLRALQARRAQIPDNDGEALASIEAQLEEAGAWSANSRAEKLLAGLGFKPEDWQRPVAEFSGGWQMRLALARALMAPSDLLLLDEPTNHLDLDAILWLERWLNGYEGTVLLISHDTEFLEAIARSILHFDQGKLVHYRGAYESFLVQRAERLRQAQQAIDRQSREMERMQSFVDRFKAKATKARQAQSRIKAMARMQTLTPLRQEAGISISIPQPEQMPDPLLILETLDAGYTTTEGATRTVLSGINLSLRTGSRIGILGVNGAGKSTLIKTLSGQIPPLSGKRVASKGLQIGYFAQHQLDMLDLAASPLQHLARLAPQAREQDLRNYLGGFGFGGDMALGKVEPMSGGEKARLALALIVWQKPNLLLLDEPSNHLDVDTREALALALAEYEGSVLLVSHDRHLLRTTVDELWIVNDGEVLEFDGSLDDYRQWQAEKTRASQAKTNSDVNNGAGPTTADSSTSAAGRKEQRRLEAEQRHKLAALRKPFEARLKKIDVQLEQSGKRLAELDLLVGDAEFYSDESLRDERIKVLAEHGELTKKLAELENQWLELQEKLEEIELEALTPDMP